ncbi:MAG: hypothetical protein HQL13_07000 [Candidatus Omnitrophica bacterium]|nr:hypothetical protein [Candidatus Omnitrophota bacterium]
MAVVFSTTVAPPIFVTDSEKQPEGRCFSEKLEKIGGKRQSVVEKITSKPYIKLTLTNINMPYNFIKNKQRATTGCDILKILLIYFLI